MAANRPSWDDYFIALARLAATRATCNRLQVGCVLVDPTTHRVVATAYNGAPPGAAHCLDEGCLIGPHGGCVRTTHAEINAIEWAGSGAAGTIAYVSHSPCRSCTERLILSGIREIFYAEPYRDTKHLVGLPIPCNQHTVVQCIQPCSCVSKPGGCPPS